MKRIGMVVVLVFCLLALSTASLADNSDGAIEDYTIFGYITGPSGAFEDSETIVVVTSASYEEGVGYTANTSYKSSAGIVGGKFSVAGIKFDTDESPELAYFFNIKSPKYSITTIPYVSEKPAIVATTMEPDVNGAELGYKMSIENLRAISETADGRQITGNLGQASTISVGLKQESTITGMVSDGDFRIIGAKVELLQKVDDALRTITEVHTDKYGKYTLKAPPEKYTLRITADGYATKEIEVDLDPPKIYDVDVDDMEKNKDTPLPRTLMILAAIVGIVVVLVSVGYRLRLRKHPQKSIIYDDEE